MTPILIMTLSGSALAAILFLLRPLLRRRFSGAWLYYIWLIVLLRLLLPVTLTIPVIQTVGPNSPVSQSSASYSSNTAPQGAAQPAAAPTQPRTPSPAFSLASIPQFLSNQEAVMLAVWLTGAWIFFLFKMARYTRFVRKLKIDRDPLCDERILAIYHEFSGEKPPVFVSGRVSEPLLIGLFRPAVLLPDTELSDGALRHIFAHELTHYRRRDLWYKWLVQLTLCIHWFNPLVHLLARQIERDCELACDEAVVKQMDPEERKQYGETILAVSAHRGKPSAAMGMSGDAEQLKARLDAMLAPRKITRAVKIAAVLTCCAFLAAGVLAGCTTKIVYVPSETPPSAAQTVSGVDLLTATPEQILQLYVDSLNKGDWDTARTLNPNGGVNSNVTTGTDGVPINQITDLTIQVDTGTYSPPPGMAFYDIRYQYLGGGKYGDLVSIDGYQSVLLVQQNGWKIDSMATSPFSDIDYGAATTAPQSGVILTLSHSTYPVGVKSVTAVLTNGSQDTIDYGFEYTVYKQNGSDWVVMPLGFDAWDSILYGMSSSGAKEYTFTFEPLSTAGHYRIEMQYYFSSDPSKTNINLYAEFDVV